MKKKYIFALKLYTYNKSYQINGQFNTIDGLQKGQNPKDDIRKIRLYKGIFKEFCIDEDFTKNTRDVYVEIEMYDKDFNHVTIFFQEVF